MKNTLIQSVIQLASYTVLLLGSITLGFLDKTAAMTLAIVAGALGLAFSNIDKIARFKGAGFEAEMREKIETIIEKETEPEPDPGKSNQVTPATLADLPLSGDEEDIIRALKNPRYTWRYIGGISNESGTQPEQVLETLEKLVEAGLARESVGEQGRIWGLTAKGRKTFAAIEYL